MNTQGNWVFRCRRLSDFGGTKRRHGVTGSIFIYFYFAYISYMRPKKPSWSSLYWTILIWNALIYFELCPKRASFEMGSSLFSTKISFSFTNTRICVCPLLKVSVLFQLSTFLLPISEVLDRKYFKSYHNLHTCINDGVSFIWLSEL